MCWVVCLVKWRISAASSIGPLLAFYLYLHKTDNAVPAIVLFRWRSGWHVAKCMAVSVQLTFWKCINAASEHRLLWQLAVWWSSEVVNRICSWYYCQNKIRKTLGHVPKWEMQLFLFRVSAHQCDPVLFLFFLSLFLWASVRERM